MTEVIGLLMIVLALSIGCWRFYKGKKLPASGLALLVLACFIGVALVLNKRVSELSFGKLATLKATVTQAQSDAEQIAAIRQRVEAQAATMDLVAKESADAKRLLTDLRKENATADVKLRLLEDKTGGITQLPDGRIVSGAMLLGRASIVFNIKTNMEARFANKQYKEAFELAKDCIKRIDDSEKLKPGSGGDFSEQLSADGLQNVYEVAVRSAILSNDFETAATWAKAALQRKQTPEMNAFLIFSLARSGKVEEAKALTNEKLAHGGADAEKIEKLLREFAGKN
jgi:BMFP domain-containing protein YqiC